MKYKETIYSWKSSHLFRLAAHRAARRAETIKVVLLLILVSLAMVGFGIALREGKL